MDRTVRLLQRAMEVPGLSLELALLLKEIAVGVGAERNIRREKRGCMVLAQIIIENKQLARVDGDLGHDLVAAKELMSR